MSILTKYNKILQENTKEPQQPISDDVNDENMEQITIAQAKLKQLETKKSTTYFHQRRTTNSLVMNDLQKLS